MSTTQDLKKIIEKRMIGSLDLIRLKFTDNPRQTEEKSIVSAEHEEQLTIDSLFLISESFSQLTQFCLTHSHHFEKFDQYRNKLTNNRQNLRLLRQKAKKRINKALPQSKKKEQVNGTNMQVQKELQNSGYLLFYNQKRNEVSDITSNKVKSINIAAQWQKMSEKQRQNYKKMVIAKQKQQLPRTQIESKQINTLNTQKQTLKKVKNETCKKGHQNQAKQSQSKEKDEETSSSQLQNDILSDSMQFCQHEAKISLPSKKVSKVSAKKQKRNHRVIKILHKQKMV